MVPANAKLLEERAMAKKLGKGEKLDLILSELSALRADLKKLLKQKAAAAEPGAKDRVRPLPALASAKTSTRASGKPAAKVPAKPAAVEADEEAPATRQASRTA